MKCPKCGTNMIEIPPTFESDASKVFPFMNKVKWDRLGDYYCPVCVGDRFYWKPIKVD